MNAIDYIQPNPNTAFVDMPDEAPPEPPRVDRSTLERWSVCPAQAALTEAGKALPVGDAANVGSEGHEAISSAISTYLENAGAMRPAELMDDLITELLGSRPDVQPSVIAAVRPSVWKIVELIKGLNPTNILRYDGGKGQKSGQLAVDAFGVRLTSEVDFLYVDPHTPSPSPDVICEVDWKTGHKLWTSADVRKSFQFQFHAYLVLKNYPGVECLRVRILNTRIGAWSWTCEFRRGDLDAIGGRINRALGEWQKHQATGEIEPWPSYEKCSLCDTALDCPACAAPLRDVKANPAGAVDQLVALEAKQDQLKKLLAAHADSTGRDIASTDGKVLFGRGAPSSERKKPAKLYEPKDGEEADANHAAD